MYKLQNLNLGQPATHSKSDAPAGLGEQRRPGENDSARPGWENTLGPVMLDQAGSRDGPSKAARLADIPT